MISYPARLPPPIRDDYGFSPANRIRRTEMDSGRARQRIEFDSVPTFTPVTFLFTAQQAALFDAWADQVAGSSWFEFPIWTPLRYESEEVRFTASPSGPIPVHGTGMWQYTAQLEVRFKPQLPDGYVLFPDYILDADILDVAVNSLWPLNPWQKYADAADKAINEDWPQP